MDKYRVHYWFKNKSGGASVVTDSNIHFIIDAQFSKDAELACKLLNENDARKNQDKKYELLSEMVQDIYNKSNSETTESMEPLIQLMDKFYNLEADDGKQIQL